MEGVREYLLSVTAAAILCSILRSICGKSMYAGMLRLLCGVFLVFTVISPLTRVRLKKLEYYGQTILEEAENTSQEGIDYAKQAKARIIKEELEAYILDKASAFHTDLRVEVELRVEDPPVPEQVTITGHISPYAKQQLQEILEQDLAIPKEKQIWKQ